MSDDGRHALALVALVGSVFSPYYARARARAPGAADPRDHCAMNVALYGPRGAVWALTERGRGALARERDALAIGPSAVRWDGDALVVTLEERSSPFPRVVPERVAGTVTLRPSFLTGESHALDAAGAHAWWPVAPAARVEVALTHPALTWAGAGYHDANAGGAPLEESFRGWHWSRAPHREGAAVLYDVVGRDGARRVVARRWDARRGAEPVAVPPRVALPATRWGVARETFADPGATARVRRTLEDTPFYARSLVATTLAGHATCAVHESLDLDRFRADWVRFLLPFRMRRA